MTNTYSITNGNTVVVPRYRIYENADGTVIEMEGNPIQFSMVLSDAQIAKYFTSRAEQQASCNRTTEQLWMAKD